MQIEKLRYSFVQNNNTILIEQFINPYEEEKGSKPRWIWLTEIDLDKKNKLQIADNIVHLSQKRWAQDNYEFFVTLVGAYLTMIDKQK